MQDFAWKERYPLTGKAMDCTLTLYYRGRANSFGLENFGK